MPSIDVITTGRVDLTAYAGSCGYLRGTRLDSEPEYRQAGAPVDFLDMHWEDPDFSELLAAARRHRPRYAVAGDYLKDEDNVDRVNERARQLRECAENIIVVPKSPGDLQHVPEWCVVGYSVPTKYGGTDIRLREYKTVDQPIHVLGGTPHRQFEVVGILWRDAVCSLDGNSIHKAATLGAKAWFPKRPHWRRVDGKHAVERAYCLSIRNLKREQRRRGMI